MHNKQYYNNVIPNTNSSNNGTTEYKFLGVEFKSKETETVARITGAFAGGTAGYEAKA